MSERILLATDGSGGADGAVRLAAALAHARGATLHAITVFEPFTLYGVGAGYALPGAELEFERVREASLEQAARAQLDRYASGYGNVPLQVEVGAPARTIVRLAEEQGASMIVVGRGEHDRVDRWFGSETALRVAQLAHVPVLAVPSTASGLPTSAVIAVDFSDTSLASARLAASLLPPGARLVLAHVSWSSPGGQPWDEVPEWIQTYDAGARARLEALGAELAAEGGHELEVELLEGEPAEELAGLRQRSGAEMIAVGSHGHGFIGRMVLGSVSGRLLREAGCTVLVSPPPQG
jgi:nucleotide-binding universal stress UspA family protein